MRQTKLNIAWSWVGRTVSVQLQVKGQLQPNQTRQRRASSHIHAWSHSANKAATKKTRNTGQFEQIVKFTCQRVLWRQIVANLNESSFTSRPWKWVQSPRGRRTVGSQPIRSSTVGSEDRKASSWVLVWEPTWTHCSVICKWWTHRERDWNL